MLICKVTMIWTIFTLGNGLGSHEFYIFMKPHIYTYLGYPWILVVHGFGLVWCAGNAGFLMNIIVNIIENG